MPQHTTPHNHSFVAWVRRHYGKPYDPRIVFQKYDREIWRLAQPKTGNMTLPHGKPVDEVYAVLIERAAAKVYSVANIALEAY